MEQEVSVLTPQQQKILELFKNESNLSSNYYFTGGTALSAYYLKHRYSDDLDFFTEGIADSLALSTIAQKWADELGITFESRQIEDRLIFDLKFASDCSLRVDFTAYPYKRLSESNLIEGIKVDSTQDIATNKFILLSQRSDVKDLVDLYYLLKEYSIFDLYNWAKIKFKRDYDLYLVASDLLKVENFNFLPRMIKKLSLTELKSYFIELSQELGLQSTS